MIVWHLLNDPTTRFDDLGSDYYDTRLNNDRKTRNLFHQHRELG